MILEGIVTTHGPDNVVNVAPMGPHVPSEGELKQFVLRPYKTSTTYRNLQWLGEGVLHVTDDVWLLARAAVGPVSPEPELFPAKVVRGHVVANTCRWHEFRVTRLDDRDDRTTIECEVAYTGRVRDFFGFNRAKHAVVEAAILATRTNLLPIGEILQEFTRLSISVRKTAGPCEVRAFQFLLNYVNSVAQRQGHDVLSIDLCPPATGGT